MFAVYLRRADSFPKLSISASSEKISDFVVSFFELGADYRSVIFSYCLSAHFRHIYKEEYTHKKLRAKQTVVIPVVSQCQSEYNSTIRNQ